VQKRIAYIDCTATGSEICGCQVDRPSLLGMAYNSNGHSDEKKVQRRADVMKIDALSKITAFVRDVSVVGVRYVALCPEYLVWGIFYVKRNVS